MIRCSGSSSSSMIDVESGTRTSPKPVIASGLGRVPASMTLTGDRIGRVPQPVRTTSTARQGDFERLGPAEMGLSLDQVQPVLRLAARVFLPRPGDHGPLALAQPGPGPPIPGQCARRTPRRGAPGRPGVLVGVYPVLTQTPPSWPRSTSATFLPVFAKSTGRNRPPWLVPITTTS